MKIYSWRNAYGLEPTAPVSHRHYADKRPSGGLFLHTPGCNLRAAPAKNGCEPRIYPDHCVSIEATRPRRSAWCALAVVFSSCSATGQPERGAYRTNVRSNQENLLAMQ